MIQELFLSLSIGGYIYAGIKIYKMIKKSKSEKNRIFKGIAYALFYEPFIIYDIIKHYRKRQEILN